MGDSLELQRTHARAELARIALLGASQEHVSASIAACAARLTSWDCAVILEFAEADPPHLLVRATHDVPAALPSAFEIEPELARRISQREHVELRRPSAIPAPLAAAGMQAGLLVPAPARARALVLAGVFSAEVAKTSNAADLSFLAQLADLAGAALARGRLVDQLSHSEQRLAMAQRIAHMGSYDWDIARDVTAWSDELYRIYGTEPQSFNASYERFLSFVHPDDREKVVAVHRKALADHQPYEMEERIIRPDGEIRTLETNGEVILDDQGRPARMAGICFDVTEQRRNEAETRRSAQQLQALVESAPDALFLVDPAGTILLVNEQARSLLGYEPGELIGQKIEKLVPDALRDRHREHRTRYVERPQTRPMGVAAEIRAVRKDGTEVFVDVSLGPVRTDEGLAVAAFARDATARRRAEADAQTVVEMQLRRRQALEINDNVVQGLSSIVYALESSNHELAVEAASGTLASARKMMADLLSDESQTPLGAGKLVRERAVEGTIESRPPSKARSGTQGDSESIRVMLADDSSDMRMLLRIALEPRHGFEVVGEAENGEEAVRLAYELRPDVLLLDLAMPVMDGLQALPQIKECSPETKVVVLSGYGATQMSGEAFKAGADAYVEKGTPASDLIARLRKICPTHGAAPAKRAPVAGGEGDDDVGALLSTYTHELRTPLTVVQGVIATLREKMDVLPSPVVAELFGSLARNVQQLAALLDTIADTGPAEPTIVSSPTEVGELVRQAVADLSELTHGHTVVVDVERSITAKVDAVRVRQVLANLLSNAAKFSAGGTPIEVRVRTAAGAVEISVRDHGRGVPPERAARLFGRFERLGVEERGLGLGLHISRSIARAHGGDLVLRHSDESGSTFVLALPAGDAALAVGGSG